ncbi:MAG: hypothetical protein AB2A00_13735 [Myxococcota bacterium]
MSAPPNVNASRLRALLYVALVVSALVAFFGIEEIQVRVMAGTLAPEWRLVPAVLFSVALVLYAVDRVLLVRRGRYPSGKAFFQVAFGLALLTLLLPGGLRDYQSGRDHFRTPDPVAALLRNPDARVRALAAEVAGYRTGTLYLRDLVDLLRDPQPSVREAARLALERRAGTTLGQGPEAADAWRRHVESMGAGRQESGQP